MSKNRIKKDHTQFICNISELSGLFTDSTSLETFLQRIVEMIAEHMNADVCSIYLYYEKTNELILKATKGLNPNGIENIKLKLGEGLTGLALKELRPICERHASQNPNFRYFPGLGEEQYESFLAVPIIRGKTMIGTMVIQNTVKNYFTEEDITALRAISSQLANTIEMTHLILSIEEKYEIKEEPLKTIEQSFIKGKVGSTGFASGEGVVLSYEKDLRLFLQNNSFRSYTLEEFQKAVKVTEIQLEKFQQQIEKKLSDVASLIFTAQILMLKDKSFIDKIIEKIKQGENPPNAIIQIADTYIQKFEQIPNTYLREKTQDVRDITKRLLRNLLGEELNIPSLGGCIVITEDLLPSDALKLSSQNVKGIILLRGGATSHVSILARSLQIPLIIADVPQLLMLPQKTKVIMDAEQGNIYINPSKEVIQSFRDREKANLEFFKSQDTITSQTHTKDGTRISLMANINLLGDVKNANNFKAEGIGLYRTEFPFIVRNDFPSEEEQYVIYKKLVAGMAGKEITFRTLDIGGDKVLSYFQHHLKEKNPYMGMRSIRFSLKHVEIFSQQIRAILRAGLQANIRIMFPMISSLDEFIDAREVVRSCIEALKKDGIPFQSNPQIGLMIELPSVLEIIDDLAQHADFFSIGTNDFIQYILAVDRTNEKVSDLYLPYHPSVLRAIKKVVDAALRHNKDISVCGDMAHETKYLNFLLGVGIRKFSLNPIFLQKVQSAIKNIRIKEAQQISELILKEKRLNDITRIIDAGG